MFNQGVEIPRYEIISMICSLIFHFKIVNHLKIQNPQSILEKIINSCLGKVAEPLNPKLEPENLSSHLLGHDSSVLSHRGGHRKHE